MQFAVDVDKAPMTLHDRQRSREAQARPLRHLFSREERFEDSALNLRGHSRSRVRDADYNKASCFSLDVHARIVFIQENVFGFD